MGRWRWWTSSCQLLSLPRATACMPRCSAWCSSCLRGGRGSQLYAMLVTQRFQDTCTRCECRLIEVLLLLIVLQLLTPLLVLLIQKVLELCNFLTCSEEGWTCMTCTKKYEKTHTTCNNKIAAGRKLLLALMKRALSGIIPLQVPFTVGVPAAHCQHCAFTTIGLPPCCHS